MRLRHSTPRRETPKTRVPRWPAPSHVTHVAMPGARHWRRSRTRGASSQTTRHKEKRVTHHPSMRKSHPQSQSFAARTHQIKTSNRNPRTHGHQLQEIIHKQVTRAPSNHQCVSIQLLDKYLEPTRSFGRMFVRSQDLINRKKCASSGHVHVHPWCSLCSASNTWPDRRSSQNPRGANHWSKVKLQQVPKSGGHTQTNASCQRNKSHALDPKSQNKPTNQHPREKK